MALGRRCSIGCETWPDEPIYGKCPVCGEPTTRFRGVDPLDSSEAQSILLHTQFETFYERWCAQKNQPAAGPLPVAELAP